MRFLLKLSQATLYVLCALTTATCSHNVYHRPLSTQCPDASGANTGGLPHNDLFFYEPESASYFPDIKRRSVPGAVTVDGVGNAGSAVPEELKTGKDYDPEQGDGKPLRIAEPASATQASSIYLSPRSEGGKTIDRTHAKLATLSESVREDRAARYTRSPYARRLGETNRNPTAYDKRLELYPNTDLKGAGMGADGWSLDTVFWDEKKAPNNSQGSEYGLEEFISKGPYSGMGEKSRGVSDRVRESRSRSGPAVLDAGDEEGFLTLPPCVEQLVRFAVRLKLLPQVEDSKLNHLPIRFSLLLLPKTARTSPPAAQGGREKHQDETHSGYYSKRRDFKRFVQAGDDLRRKDGSATYSHSGNAAPGKDDTVSGQSQPPSGDYAVRALLYCTGTPLSDLPPRQSAEKKRRTASPSRTSQTVQEEEDADGLGYTANDVSEDVHGASKNLTSLVATLSLLANLAETFGDRTLRRVLKWDKDISKRLSFVHPDCLNGNLDFLKSTNNIDSDLLQSVKELTSSGIAPVSLDPPGAGKDKAGEAPYREVELRNARRSQETEDAKHRDTSGANDGAEGEDRTKEAERHSSGGVSLRRSRLMTVGARQLRVPRTKPAVSVEPRVLVIPQPPFPAFGQLSRLSRDQSLGGSTPAAVNQAPNTVRLPGDIRPGAALHRSFATSPLGPKKPEHSLTLSSGTVSRPDKRSHSPRLFPRTSPLPWHCPSNTRWRDLGHHVFPRYVQETSCGERGSRGGNRHSNNNNNNSGTCWYGFYNCRPSLSAVQVLVRHTGVCNDSRVPQSIRRHYFLSVVNIHTGCVCR